LDNINKAFKTGEYEKTEYKYYSTQRPVDIGTFPKTGSPPARIVNFDERKQVENGLYLAWGYLVYGAPLTEKQIGDYELAASPDNPDMKERLRDQTHVVGSREEYKRPPEKKRLTCFNPDKRAYVSCEPAVKPERLEERFRAAVCDLNLEPHQPRKDKGHER